MSDGLLCVSGAISLRVEDVSEVENGSERGPDPSLQDRRVHFGSLIQITTEFHSTSYQAIP